MKTRLFVAVVGLLALVARSGAMAADAGAKGPRIDLDQQEQARPRKPAPPPADNTRSAAPGAKDGKEEARRQVDGMEISRGERGYLGVKIEGGNFKVSFYDREKKPVAADVDRIVLRWPVQYQPNPERTLLLPTEDGKAMTSEKVVRPPHSFKLFITLLKDGAASGEPAETYVVDFRS